MSNRLIIGVVLLLLVGGVIVAVQFMSSGEDSDDGGEDIVTVVGDLGGEKENFMKNPEVQRILRERFNIEVDFTKNGSIAMVEEPATGKDFLWPSNEVALELYKERNPGSVKNETIFNSPIVMYSWDNVTEALINEGIVEQNNQAYYIVDMPRLVESILGDREWADIGLTEYPGKMRVISTDPTESNSGNMFFGLLMNMLAQQEFGEDVATETTAPQILPTVLTYYERQGIMSTSSGDLFERYVQLGRGESPIIVGYESQLIELSVATDATTVEPLRILYPRPTVWSSHPLIALTDKGEKLIEALQDPELQQIAWEQHGFRSGLSGVRSDPADLNLTGIPLEIASVLPLPRPSVMQAMLTYLQTGGQQ